MKTTKPKMPNPHAYSISLLKMNLSYHSQRVKILKRFKKTTYDPKKLDKDLEFHSDLATDLSTAIKKLNAKKYPHAA